MGTAVDNRGPVSTYEQALMWLVKHWGTDWPVFLGASVLPPEARLVADMFWVTDAQLRYRLNKLCREADRDAAPAPPRKFWGRAWTR